MAGEIIDLTGSPAPPVSPVSPVSPASPAPPASPASPASSAPPAPPVSPSPPPQPQPARVPRIVRPTPVPKRNPRPAPRPRRPRVVRPNAVPFPRRINFKRGAMPFSIYLNSYLPYYCATQQVPPPWVVRRAYDELTGMITARLQACIHGVFQAAAAYEPPAPASNPFLFPQGATLEEPWTPIEHGMFLMGLIKCGRGRWTKISRDFVWSKTPQQVQSYAASFLRHLRTTYLDGFNQTNLACAFATADLITNENYHAAPASYPMMVNHPEPLQPEPLEPQPTCLMLFPVEAPAFFSVPGATEVGCSTATFGFQVQTVVGGASASMTATADVDLELRLGGN